MLLQSRMPTGLRALCADTQMHLLCYPCSNIGLVVGMQAHSSWYGSGLSVITRKLHPDGLSALVMMAHRLRAGSIKPLKQEFEDACQESERIKLIFPHSYSVWNFSPWDSAGVHLEWIFFLTSVILIELILTDKPRCCLLGNSRSFQVGIISRVKYEIKIIVCHLLDSVPSPVVCLLVF